MDALKEELYEYLANCISDNKRQKFDQISSLRTRYMTIVLEDIYQPQNASAVIRTSECFGLQDIHIIENKNKYNINPDVVMGSSKWINLHRYRGEGSNTRRCLQDLKDQGYRIIATTPHTNDIEVGELDVTKGKFAIVFGTEIDGLSGESMAMADEYVKIPMYGFTESLNISVSAGICAFSLISRIRNSDVNWKLSEEEILDLKIGWARTNLIRPELIENEFYRKKGLEKR